MFDSADSQKLTSFAGFALKDIVIQQDCWVLHFENPNPDAIDRSKESWVLVLNKENQKLLTVQ